MIYIFYYSIFFVFGTIFGSFLNAAIWRARHDVALSKGRSMCPECKHTLSWYELIPLVSFAIQKGQCRACHRPISWQYPIVECIVGVLFVFVGYQHQMVLDMEVFRDLLLVLVLIYIFVYDLKYQLILDRISLPAIAVFFIWNVLMMPAAWPLYLIGGLLGAGFFLFQFVVSKGQWIGGGDIRLGALMGVVLGWKLLLVALLLAYVSGAFVGIWLLLLKKADLASKTAFGTYLSLATLVTMFYGQQILDWYIQFL